MDLKDIKAIVDLMKKNALSEFELEHQDFKIKLKRACVPANTPDDAPAYLVPATPTAAPAISSQQIQSPQAPLDYYEIKSPMIGTFYRAPSPDTSNLVEVGAPVTPDTVVCVIEAMKVMNEIKAETKGVISQILVENAKPVEFGQPLFRIRPT
jgi:acetyl-CoA carboxylase biotin carboxyl carrier protein